MRRLIGRRYRVTASALIVALVAFCANCVQGANPIPEQTASSAAMPDDCPMTSQRGRCAGELLKVQQGPVAKQLVLSPPSSVPAPSAVYAEPPLLESQFGGATNGAVLRLPGVPTYLLDSTFRI
jgi:hypothetical protein